MLLDRGAWVDQPSQYESTPLSRASLSGHTEVCALLLGRGACVDQPSQNGITPLWFAVKRPQGDIGDAARCMRPGSTSRK